MSKRLRRCRLISLAVVLVLSVCPLMMGARILVEVARHGTVMSCDYSKYVIPYTPISLAVLTGTALIPLLLRRNSPSPAVSALALAAFLYVELLLGNVLVTCTVPETRLESWQMFMCYQPITRAVEMTDTPRMPDALTEVEILMGAYDPSLKLHFYMISVVLILGTLSCLYGFAREVRTGDWNHLRLLIAQAAATGAFLAMCVLTCFTAFFRDGQLLVSSLSAALMAIFSSCWASWRDCWQAARCRGGSLCLQSVRGQLFLLW